MYNNQSLDERIQGSVCNEGYDFGNEVSGSRYFMKWSPQEDMKFYSKSRCGSSRMLSKSVPRKNKNLTRCRINRSLNFDAGIPKADLKFKSPNSSLDSICCDEEKQLSRSAKIMKALNLGNSPISIGKKKVNKSLNFDFSPSPKRLMHYNRSPCNIVHLNLSTSSPKISKSLNFESSPAESNISSILGTSIDSIDENQNQTPSQRRRSVKKSLKYLTPQRKSSPFNLHEKSPMLRSELREKIDNIIQISSPNIQSLKKSHRKPPFVKDNYVSTPRNLFNDFEDVDCGGPKTPNNRIRLVPESMSAIKRSHKKERFNRRLEAEVTPKDIFDDELAQKLDILKEQRSSTPPVQEELKNSKFDINSIKRSNKKDKNHKSPLNRSGDELSDGSIFNYSEIKDISSSCDGSFIYVKSERNKEDGKVATKVSEKAIVTPAKLKYDSDSDINSVESPAPKSKENIEICITSPTTPSESEIVENLPVNDENPENSGRPSTPKNRIDLLQRVIGSSIKKSHKKLKDEKKKRILRPRILDETDSNRNGKNLNDNEPQASCSNTERSTTPENVNSSRLLLPNFSSVKKSHKKDKTSKILSNFARRQKIFSYDKEKLSTTHSGFKSQGLMERDFKNYSLQHFDCNEESSKPSEILGERAQLSPHSSKSSFHSSESSPQKRKLSSCSDVDDAFSPLSMDDSECIDFVTADEEFKIFTPIKRKKSAPSRKLTAKGLENVALDNFQDVPLTRCVTPILDQSKTEESNFFTPERNINCEPKGKSTPKNKITPMKNKTTPENKITPKNNRSALELIANVNSVKKSHKKEKKGNRFSFKNESTRFEFETETPVGEIKTDLMNVSTFLTPESSLHSNNMSETSFKNISLMASKFLQSYECDGSKPSTSYESKDEEVDEKKTSKQLVSTPPNLLKTKEYLRTRQSESIKKSHKKKREELKHSIILQDSELSNDGSIFSDEDRNEDFPTDCAINKKNNGKSTNTRDRVSIVVNMNESIFNKISEKKRTSRRSNHRIRILSNDGSLFGSDEE